MKKTKLQSNKPKFALFGILVFTLAICLGVGVTIKIRHVEINVEVPNVGAGTEEPVTIEYGQDLPSYIEGDKGDITEQEGIPTVESIDGGGKFEDIKDAETEDGMYHDAGAIEWVDTSSVDSFVNSTLGRCIIANNYYGAQCVSLARAFWWGYAGRDVTTCGTGLAKGMMNCYEDNAGSDFAVVWNTEDIQRGTWVVLNGSYTGHICMALGDVKNGYVTCLGENQGGASCGSGVGGSATNIINLSMKDFIGGYTPKAYIIPDPVPEPEPTTDNCKVRKVIKGDTLGKIMKECEGKITWGAAMEEYAKHWYSTVINPEHTVFYGWTHGTGYGLFANDVIEYR